MCVGKLKRHKVQRDMPLPQHIITRKYDEKIRRQAYCNQTVSPRRHGRFVGLGSASMKRTYVQPNVFRIQLLFCTATYTSIPLRWYLSLCLPFGIPVEQNVRGFPSPIS